MGVVASCPSCGAALSEVAVLALASLCDHCGAVITGVDGSQGFTSAYGVNDPSFSRRATEAHLGFLQGDLGKYRGMLEHCKQKLAWGVERYAKLPQPPVLLNLEKVPPISDGLTKYYWGYLIPVFLVTLLSLPVIFPLLSIMFPPLRGMAEGSVLLFFVMVLGNDLLVSLWLGRRDHLKAKTANGVRPQENTRRQREYEEAVSAALRAAAPLKAAEDYRLRCQVRDLEGLIATLGQREAEVRQRLVKL